MADEFSFEDAKSAAPAPAPPPKAFSFEDAKKPDAAPEPDDRPMPGPLDALGQGAAHSWEELKQSAGVIGGDKAPKPIPTDSPAASDLELRDLYSPVARGVPKLAYRLGAGSPAVAGGIAGGYTGGLAGSWGGPAAAGVGGLAGGALGAGLGAAVQAIGPDFAAELRKSPDDPDKAWTNALEHASASGLFSSAAWAAFPLRLAGGPLKNAVFQVFGIQPGLSVAEKGVQNIISGDDVTKGMGQAYVEGAAGTVIPAVGHTTLAKKEAIPDPTPAQVLQGINDKLDQARTLDTQSLAPGVHPRQAADLQQQADSLRSEAQFDHNKMTAPARVQALRTQADTFEQQANNPLPPDSPASTRGDLVQKAAAFRKEADFQEFLGKIPPPLPPPTGIGGKLSRMYGELIDPSTISDKALQIEPIIAEYKSKEAQGRDSELTRMQKRYPLWNKVPWDDTREFMLQYETGSRRPMGLLSQYPWMASAGADFHKWLLQSYDLEEKNGSTADFVQNYLGHLWENPKKATDYFGGILQNLGPKWFQKERFYGTIQAGLDAGLKLKYTNPEELVARRLMSGQDMVNRMQMLTELKKNGVAIEADQAPDFLRNPPRGATNTWMPVDAPNQQRWLIAPDAQALWKNGVEAKGLWANQGIPGNLFRGWMNFKAAWTQVKLGLSLFHPDHVLHIAGVNNLSRALVETFGSGQQGMLRRMYAMPEAVGQVMTDWALAAPIGTPFIGKDMRKAWSTPKSEQTAQQLADTRLMNEAGTSAQLSEELRWASGKIRENIKNGNYFKAAGNAVATPLHTAFGWIFEQWIPNLKMAAVKRDAEALFRARPDLLTDPVNRRLALRTIGKAVDNRFGEMFYGSLFWNRTLKDAAIGSFLSLGWNLGFIREFGGGVLEGPMRKLIGNPTPSRKLIRDVSRKATNAFLYTATAMIVNSVINKANTGDWAEGMDYIFPRIGGLNPDGSPRRVTNPFFTREVPMALKNIEDQQSVASGLMQMMYHKMMFAPLVEGLRNKDYFGYQIYNDNPETPGYKQLQQIVSHVLTEDFSPMAVSGMERALELSGKPHTLKDIPGQLTDKDVYMPFLGFGPAPAYASKSPLENRIGHLFGERVAPERRAFELAGVAKERAEARTAYMGAQQRGDKDAELAGAKKLAELGMTSKQISNLKPGEQMLYMYSRLQKPDQVSLLKSMSPEEFKRYYPKSSRTTKADEAIRKLVARYYQ